MRVVCARIIVVQSGLIFSILSAHYVRGLRVTGYLNADAINSGGEGRGAQACVLGGH